MTAHALVRGACIFLQLYAFPTGTEFIFAGPLRRKKIIFEDHEIALDAPFSRCVFFLNGLPVDVLSSQCLQQEFWPLWRASREQFSVERTINQQIIGFPHTRQRHVARDRACAATYLQIYDSGAQSLPLRRVRSDGKCWSQGQLFTVYL